MHRTGAPLSILYHDTTTIQQNKKTCLTQSKQRKKPFRIRLKFKKNILEIISQLKNSRDNHSSTKALTCEQHMNSNNWTWSEEKKACVYKVSITSAN